MISTNGPIAGIKLRIDDKSRISSSNRLVSTLNPKSIFANIPNKVDKSYVSPCGLLLVTFDSKSNLKVYLTKDLTSPVASFTVEALKEVTFTTYKQNPIALMLVKDNTNVQKLTAVYKNDKNEWIVAVSRSVSEETRMLNIGKIADSENLFIIAYFDSKNQSDNIVYGYLALDQKTIKLSPLESLQSISSENKKLVGINSFIIGDNFYSIWMEEIDKEEISYEVKISYGLALGTESQTKEFSESRKYEIKDTTSFNLDEQGFKL